MENYFKNDEISKRKKKNNGAVNGHLVRNCFFKKQIGTGHNFKFLFF